MRTLKTMINRYMYHITWVLLIIILVIILYIQLINEQRRAYESATRTIYQIEQILAENQKELEEIKEQYKQTCLHNAESVARMIQTDPGVMDNVDELNRIADMVEVDEIHLFDEKGNLFAGTHPEYIGYSFDSGKQMEFFKTMLSDKSQKLVQEVTLNTAQNKEMQYSAVWTKNGEFIVQVGMDPRGIKKVTEKNELSHIFSLLRVNSDVNYYAIDIATNKVVGTTDQQSMGKSVSQIGLNPKRLGTDKDGFHANISGQFSFCVFEKSESNYIGRVISGQKLYQRVPTTIIIFAVCLMFIIFILANAVTRYMNRYVVDKIYEINEKLNLIASGNLDERVEVDSSIEFYELSNYINTMVKSILHNNQKLSYVLNKTNLNIGVYEYSKKMQSVHFTEHIPKMLSMTEKQTNSISSNAQKFEQIVDKIRERGATDEKRVYKVCEQPERFVKIEEIVNEEEVFGVVVDMTSEIMKRREIEAERDIDMLTGLYNRRGLETKLSVLFSKPKKLGYSALIMMDADDLKKINDKYGHEFGDVYLKKLAAVINNFGIKGSVASRQGGDEFVLFLYEYDSKDELDRTIQTLAYIRDNSTAHLSDELTVPLRFSFGYCYVGKNADFKKLLKEADEKMYKDKKNRKNK